MQRTTTLTVAVGIFFIVGVLLLFGLSLKASGPGARGGMEIATEVHDSKGLEVGAEVLRAGVPVGVVEKLSLAENGESKVLITMRLFKTARVHKDAVASIRLKSMLGTYYVHLTHGTTKSPLVAANDRLSSEEMGDINTAFTMLGKMGGEAESLVSSVNKNQQQFFDKVNHILDENRTNVKTVTDSLAKSAPKMEHFLDSVAEVSDALSSGTGTIGKLLKSDEVYENVRAASANIKDISGKVKSGEGLLGKMIYDDKMAGQLQASIGNIDKASKSLSDAFGPNGSDLRDLIHSLKDSAPKITETVDNLLAVSKKVNSGQGTLGKLVNDPSLYDETHRAVTQIRKTFEEGEEQSVMRTFLGVFFGSMI